MWKLLRKYFMPVYSSQIDQFLAAFDKAHPKRSRSQRREQSKYRAIYKLRDSQPTQKS